MIEPTARESDKPLRYLNPELSLRLRSATNAIRKLRELGYKVASQDLRQGESRKPLLRLESGDEELRRRCTQVLVYQGNGSRVITARLANCDVVWSEAYVAGSPAAQLEGSVQ